MISLTLEPSFMTYMAMTRISTRSFKARKLTSSIHELTTLFFISFFNNRIQLPGYLPALKRFSVDNFVVVLVILCHMYIDELGLSFILESVGHICQDDIILVSGKNSLISLFLTLISRMFFYYKH